MDDTKSVRQSKSIVLHKSSLNDWQKYKIFLTSGKTNANYLQTTLFLLFFKGTAFIRTPCLITLQNYEGMKALYDFINSVIVIVNVIVTSSLPSSSV